MQSCYCLPGFDLIQSKCESEAAGQLFNATHVGRSSVQIGPLILYQLVKELRTNRRYTNMRKEKDVKIHRCMELLVNIS